MSQIFETQAAQYRHLRELGSGAQGETHLVERLRDGQRFALKQLTFASAETWKAIELFEREAEVLQALSHPHIPSYVDHEADADRDAFLLIQQYVEGESLDQFMGPSRPLSNALLERYLRQCLEVLDYLANFSTPVIHRDIKPQNILADGQNAYIIDFGAVRVALGDKTSQTSVGTFGYMAPEQILGKTSPASDLYSLGMTFTALIARRSPQEFPMDPNTGQIDSRALLSRDNPLQAVLIKMTRPGLAERLGSARQALEMLDNPQRSQPHNTSRPQLLAPMGQLNSAPNTVTNGYFAQDPPSAPANHSPYGAQAPQGGSSSTILIVSLGLLAVVAMGAGVAFFTVSAPEPQSASRPQVAITEQASEASEPQRLPPVPVANEETSQQPPAAITPNETVVAEVKDGGEAVVAEVQDGDETVSKGRLLKSDIQRVIRSYQPRARRCYERELVKDPKLAGKIIVKFTVTPAGKVGQASIKDNTLNEKLANCLLKSIRRLRFPSFQGEAVTITYPFIFSSN